MSESVEGTGESQPADDIRSALASALASHEEADTAAEKPAKNGTAKTGDEGATASEATAAEVEGEKEPAEKTAEPETEKAAEPEKPTAEKSEAEKAAEKAAAKEPPANWSAADKAAFKALPDPAKDFLLNRHKAMEADHTRKTQAIAALKAEYEPVEQLFAPYKETMKAKGFTPRTVIQAWANVETELAAGDDRAVKIVQGLVTGYKIPVAKIAAALGLTAPAARQAKPSADGKPLPAVEGAAEIKLPAELLERISKIESFATTETQRRATEAAERIRTEENRVMSAIEQFKSASDDKGALLHPHFDEVEADMTALANGFAKMGQPVPPLDQLYERAVWANPSTREKVRTAEQQAAERKRADEARAKAAAAKRAGASVTGAPGAGQAPNRRATSDLSLREQLLEAAEEVEA